MIELSIIVPCPSDEHALPDFIDLLSQHLMGNPGDVEIIIILNESCNEFNNIVDHARENYPWLKFRFLQKRGKYNPIGSMIRFGLAFSSSQYAVLVSPYGDEDVSIINKMLGIIRKGAQLVQVTRYSSPEDTGTVQLKFRMYQSVYRLLAKILLGLKSTDFTYGYKMFDRIFVQAVGLTQNSHAISPEITIKTLLAGGEIEYLSSAVKPVQIGAKFKLFKDGPGYFWLLLRGFIHRTNLIQWF